mmetsp:Transcript_3532/g.12901  ORF Transcript_3532/g.12901 Transcript_3532/m.12901 type:complete len:270 (+) Transcript_3532:773-1582(+)
MRQASLPPPPPHGRGGHLDVRASDGGVHATAPLHRRLGVRDVGLPSRAADGCDCAGGNADHGAFHIPELGQPCMGLCDARPPPRQALRCHLPLRPASLARFQPAAHVQPRMGAERPADLRRGAVACHSRGGDEADSGVRCSRPLQHCLCICGAGPRPQRPFRYHCNGCHCSGARTRVHATRLGEHRLGLRQVGHREGKLDECDLRRRPRDRARVLPDGLSQPGLGLCDAGAFRRAIDASFVGGDREPDRQLFLAGLEPHSLGLHDVGMC